MKIFVKHGIFRKKFAHFYMLPLQPIAEATSLSREIEMKEVTNLLFYVKNDFTDFLSASVKANFYKCEICPKSKFTFLFLGATPDGIFNNCCVEVKCPLSRCDEDQKDWEKMTNKELGTFFLKNTDEGLKLDENHIYFTQCQIQMYVLGLKMTHFVV